MAAIDFPSNPNSGDQFVVGTVTWTYDGAKWTAYPGVLSVPDAPSDGKLYGRQLVASTMSWTPVGSGDTDAPIDNSLYGRKNRGWIHPTHLDITDWTATLAPYALTANVPGATSTLPKMDGTAATGSEVATFARGDHVHPSDTSRAAASALAGYLPLTGGTLTGALTISGAAGTGRNLIGATAGVNRWLMQPGNSTAEGGSNTGSDFGLTAYADNGSTVIGTALLITRSTMAATFGGSLTCVSAKFNADPNFAIGGVGAENVFTLGSGYFLGYNRTTNLLRWVTTGNTIQAMTIDAPGNLTINGTATKPGGGSWAAPSDARIKTVEGDYKGGLDEVIKLAPVVYRYKGNDADPNAGLTASEARAEGPQLVGLVAQAVEAIMPEMVTSGPGFIDGVAVDDLRALDTTPLIFALVNAVKTLAARVAELEAAQL